MVVVFCDTNIIQVNICLVIHLIQYLTGKNPVILFLIVFLV